jgi:hypothetical protein
MPYFFLRQCTKPAFCEIQMPVLVLHCLIRQPLFATPCSSASASRPFQMTRTIVPIATTACKTTAGRRYFTTKNSISNISNMHTKRKQKRSMCGCLKTNTGISRRILNPDLHKSSRCRSPQHRNWPVPEH